MDNLEKLYKKSFEEFERKPKGDFWARLEPVLPPKPDENREKRRLLIAFFAGLLFMLLLFMGNELLINKGNGELGTFPVQMQGSSLKKYSIIKTEKNSNDSVDSLNERSLSTLIEKTIQKQNNLLSPIKKKEKILVNAAIAETQILKTEKIVNKKLIASLNLPIKTKSYPFLKQAIITPLAINNRPLFSKEKQRKKGRKAKKTNAKRSKYPYIGMEYVPASIGLFSINDHLTNTKFKEIININSTKGWAINTGIKFDNKLIFQIGVHHTQFQLTKKSQVAIPTNLSNATSNENDWIQQYSFQDIAMTEPLKGNITVSAPKDAFQNGDIFLLNIGMQQTIKTSGISSELGYSFRLSPRWSIQPKIGISASWGQKGKVLLTAATVVDTRQQLLESSISNTNVTTHSLIEGLVTTEFAYRYSRRISITGAPQLRMSFAPFFNNYQRSVQHHFGQLKVGIRIHL